MVHEDGDEDLDDDGGGGTGAIAGNVVLVLAPLDRGSKPFHVRSFDMISDLSRKFVYEILVYGYSEPFHIITMALRSRDLKQNLVLHVLQALLAPC